MSREIEQLLLSELTRDRAYTGFITGAGISVASGIPTFRGKDPGAVWANEVMEKGTRRFFERKPVESWKFYLDRFDGCRSARPNPAHTAIAEIERRVKALVVTQNIDGLHVVGGSRDPIEIHGSARKMRCSKRSCVNAAPRGFLAWDDAAFDAFRADPTSANLVRCEACGKLIRAHVLWFDEMYDDHRDYGFHRFRQEVPGMTCLVFVGTSFSVGITDMAIQIAELSGIEMVVIDPFMTEGSLPHSAMHLLTAPSEEVLPRIVASM